MDRPVAWMVPKIITFEGAEHTNCPEDFQGQEEGTVVWYLSLVGDVPPVTDKFGVAHKPRPLVYGEDVL